MEPPVRLKPRSRRPAPRPPRGARLLRASPRTCWLIKWRDDLGEMGDSEIVADTVVDALSVWRARNPERQVSLVIASRIVDRPDRAPTRAPRSRG